MNSDLIPSFPESNSSTSEQTLNENTLEEIKARQQPIPPPSEPMQYRAIGLVRGRYQASDEQFTQGTLVAADSTELQAVLLGRIISLLRNHLDLAQEHLWVVYPRTGQKQDNLHLQIVGVWEPERLAKQQTQEGSEDENQEQGVNRENFPENSSPLIDDGYFSVRGEVIYQSAADGQLVVKIKQAPRKESDKPKHFKIKLHGVLKTKAVGQFWDLQVRREADNLVLQHAEAIAHLPKPPKPKPKKRINPRPAEGITPRSNFSTPRPVRKTGDSTSSVSRPIPKTPIPKPTKRPKPPQ